MLFLEVNASSSAYLRMDQNCFVDNYVVSSLQVVRGEVAEFEQCKGYAMRGMR